MELTGTGLYKAFGSQIVLNHVDVSLRKGEIVGLLGLNGAGKTTLLKILAGINIPDAGSIEKSGATIAYMSERNPLYPHMYVREYLEWIASISKIKNHKRVIEDLILKVGLNEVTGKKIKHISKGFRQRVGLASVMISDPEIIILDEPVNGLDPLQIEQYRTFVKSISSDKIIILSSHLMQEIEALCDRVYLLKDGVLQEQIMDGDSSAAYKLEFRTNKACDTFQLEQLENVSQVKEIGTHHYLVLVQDGAAIEEDIFDLIVDSGIKLVEMKRVDSSYSKFFQ